VYPEPDLIQSRDDAIAAAAERYAVSGPASRASVNPVRQQVLDSAGRAVNGARAADYGHPEDNLGRIAALFTAFLAGRVDPAADITAAEVSLLMTLVKVARLQASPGHMDSWTDIAGYAAIGAEVSDDGRER
jgi:hypothetical protein